MVPHTHYLGFAPDPTAGLSSLLSPTFDPPQKFIKSSTDYMHETRQAVTMSNVQNDATERQLLLSSMYTLVIDDCTTKLQTQSESHGCPVWVCSMLAYRLDKVAGLVYQL